MINKAYWLRIGLHSRFNCGNIIIGKQMKRRPGRPKKIPQKYELKKGLNDDTVCHYTTPKDWSWYNFQSAMYNSNLAQEFIPLKNMKPEQRKALANNDKPTGEELDSYPLELLNK